MSEITVEAACGTTKDFDARSEAEDGIDTHLALCEECPEDDIVAYKGDRPDDLDAVRDGGPGVVEETTQIETAEHDNRPAEPPATDTTTEPDDANQGDDLPSDIPVDKDPLDVLPGYMIDHVQGQPALNKRGLSVLAYNYGVTVVGREIIVSPHESDWQHAIVETTVENEDGNRFVGTGTAHVDRGDDKEILLEMAETRSYKRSVSFATGTGIVSYQELTNQLE